MALVIGNWKMHLDVAGSSLLVERLARLIEHSENEIILCPSFVALASVHKMLDERNLKNLFKLGAQNMYFEDDGAFTGETSPLMLKPLVDYVILGHSERRHIFNERDDVIARKMAAAVRHELTPILCVGETLAEHEAGEAQRVVQDQLDTCLHELTAEDADGMIVAYEPVWAIGTGRTAHPDEAEKMFIYIRHYLGALFGEPAMAKVPILYGGSVDDDSAAGFLRLPDCGGVLVGGASLIAEKFAAIASASA